MRHATVTLSVCALAFSITHAHAQCCGHDASTHPDLLLRPAPHTGCTLMPADPAPGDPVPRFDPAAWSLFTPRSAPQFQVFLDDPFNQLATYATGILSNMNAACARWAQVLDAPAGQAIITIYIRVDNSYPRATGRSETSVFIGNVAGINVFDQGAAYEIRTGTDPNGAVIDAQITLNTSYVSDELWFDPDPATRTTPVPANRTDAVSVFLHELGHVLGFNGWRDNFNGNLPGNYMSPFDQFTTFNSNFYFHGAAAQGSYGAPVPLTYANAKHVANNPPRPGSDLIMDLMNGVVFFRGTRYDITPLDLAILDDCGLTISSGGCDSVDFNNDGLFPDTQDVDDFLSVFGGGACSNDPNCNDVDFNNDGLFPDTQDVESLLSVFGGGPCL